MTPSETLLSAQLAGVPLQLTVVSSQADMVRGLSGQLTLPANQGMLFTYTNQAQRNFWMKDMRFPIDIVWLRQGVVVGAAEQLPAPNLGVIARVTSPEGIDQVLELNAGFVARYGIQPGDQLELLTD